MLAGIELADPALSARVATGLVRVEDLLERELISEFDFVTEAASHLMHAGGKRFRPLFTLVAAGAGPPPEAEEVITASAVVELIHLATLYHDDVMDEADVRRGAASANTRFTNTVAILTGDYLFARASDLTASLGTEATHIQSRTFGRLVEGQISETAGPAEGQDAVEHHLQVIADKTASLISTSARLGALLSGAPAADVETIARFGELYGIAFQLSDDLIDIVSDATELGKTPGTDLREGIRTLPVLLVLAQDDPGSSRLRELLDDDLNDDARLGEARQLRREPPAMAEARARMTAYADEACEVAGALPAGPTRDALLA